MASLVERYSAFIIDLDGVMYLLNDPIPGSAQTVKELVAAGKSFVFLTNNSSATPEQYVQRLLLFDVEVTVDRIVSSSHAVALHLERGYETAGKTAFAIGEDGLRTVLRSVGLQIVEGDEARVADFVFVGWDRDFDFEKLKTAVIAIRNGAAYIATNTDATYPTPQGLWPGAGSIVAAVTTGSGREPEVAGKPNPLIVELALQRMEAVAGDALLIGDRLDSDIKAGLAAGVDTLLVLTGVSSREEIDEIGMHPTHVRENLAAILTE